MYDIAEPMSMPFVAQDFFQPNVSLQIKEVSEGTEMG